ncbi:MAG: putative dual-specificity RNA methyltransferase RlmN [Lentisphaerae bacterium ADurb.Bin242]|nr:MAG: putative dual-specificity RNA methyltransferase RlmN [Lentisphaerae bacterium ADurb.Bin242]
MRERTDRKMTSGTCDSEKFLATAAPEQLSAFIKNSGESAYRAGQIYNWVSKKWITDPADMTNLPASTKEKLKENFVCGALRTEKEETCEDGSRKLLLSLPDGETVECAVLEALDGRTTFCLSTQVGCPVRCAFCASGASGFVRDLRAGEIVEEYLLCCRLVGKAPDNVVIMGVGEPLLNCENLVEALETICNPEGIGLAARRVTISTSGWTPGIRELARHGRQWNLAVSLHGGDDKTRALLIPGKYRRDIRDIIEACKLHKEATGRLLTFEYVLLAGINDSTEQATKLARIAGEANAKVNLIPYNKANGAFERPSKDIIKKFENTLKMLRIPVTVRVEKGFESSAACGQLRSSAAEKRKKE